MSHRSDRRFGPDTSGVSEVISYLFGFVMSIMILVTSFYAFSQVNATAQEEVAKAQVHEVVNRVSLGVQETLLVASARQESLGTADSSLLRFAHTLTVPLSVQGWVYTVTLDQNFVTATIPARAVTVQVPTFNAAVSLPPPGVCTPAYIVCTITGTNGGELGQITMAYQFDDTGPLLVNRIEIT